jgi:hypothetical protein
MASYFQMPQAPQNVRKWVRIFKWVQLSTVRFVKNALCSPKLGWFLARIGFVSQKRPLPRQEFVSRSATSLTSQGVVRYTRAVAASSRP